MCLAALGLGDSLATQHLKGVRIRDSAGAATQDFGHQDPLASPRGLQDYFLFLSFAYVTAYGSLTEHMAIVRLTWTAPGPLTYACGQPIGVKPSCTCGLAQTGFLQPPEACSHSKVRTLNHQLLDGPPVTG